MTTLKSGCGSRGPYEAARECTYMGMPALAHRIQAKESFCMGELAVYCHTGRQFNFVCADDLYPQIAAVRLPSQTWYLVEQDGKIRAVFNEASLIKPKTKNQIDFSNALESIKEGRAAYREGWNGKGLTVHIQRPDEHSKMTAPYFYLECNLTGITTRTPWVPSVSDILAEDWVLV